MTADEKLVRIMTKIERAKKHFDDLQLVSQAFFASNPYTVGVKRDPQSRKPVYYVTSIQPFPVEFYTITADVIHNLRVSLDHLAYQLFLVGPDGRQNAEFNFPFRNNSSQFESFLRGVVKSLRQDAIEALRSLEPYRGGKGHELWVLNRLNNIDKHRLLVTVGSSYGGVNVIDAIMKRTIEKMWPDSTRPKFDLFVKPADKLCPLKAGDELFIDVPEAEFNDELQFRFTVSFNELGVAEAKPVGETLKNFGELVSNTVASFKPCLA